MESNSPVFICVMWPFTRMRTEATPPMSDRIQAIIDWTKKTKVNAIKGELTHLGQIRKWGLTKEADAIYGHLQQDLRNAADFTGGIGPSSGPPTLEQVFDITPQTPDERLPDEDLTRLRSVLNTWISDAPSGNIKSKSPNSPQSGGPIRPSRDSVADALERILKQLPPLDPYAWDRAHGNNHGPLRLTAKYNTPVQEVVTAGLHTLAHILSWNRSLVEGCAISQQLDNGALVLEFTDNQSRREYVWIAINSTLHGDHYLAYQVWVV